MRRPRTAAGQAIDQVRIDGAERELTPLGAHARSGHVLQEPGELRSAEVGVEHEAGDLPHSRLVPPGLEAQALLSRPAILPDDGFVNRLSGVSFPKQGRLSLVGDADGGDVGALHARAR